MLCISMFQKQPIQALTMSAMSRVSMVFARLLGELEASARVPSVSDALGLTQNHE